MLVTHVLGDCLGCRAKDSFGNVSVHDTVLRGCKHCKYESMVWLHKRKRAGDEIWAKFIATVRLVSPYA